jgi:hypothetical protein
MRQLLSLRSELGIRVLLPAFLQFAVELCEHLVQVQLTLEM